jgi:hypothetical protein
MPSMQERIAPVIERWTAGDFGGWDDVFAPDMLLTGFDADGHGKARGPDEINAYLRGFFEQFSSFRIEADSFAELDDRTLLLEGRQFAIGRGSGLPIDETLFVVFRFEGETLAGMHWHPKREGALAAAGLTT